MKHIGYIGTSLKNSTKLFYDYKCHCFAIQGYGEIGIEELINYDDKQQLVITDPQGQIFYRQVKNAWYAHRQTMKQNSTGRKIFIVLAAIVGFLISLLIFGLIPALGFAAMVGVSQSSNTTRSKKVVICFVIGIISLLFFCGSMASKSPTSKTSSLPTAVITRNI